MLGGLSLKWNWRKRREAEGESTANPNLVFGGDVHVVWEKFCRYSTWSRGLCRCSQASTRSDQTMSAHTSTRTPLG